MEHAQSTLNQLLASREDFRLKVEVTGHPSTLAWHSWLLRPTLASLNTHLWLCAPPLPTLFGDFQNTWTKLEHNLSLTGCGGLDKSVSMSDT